MVIDGDSSPFCPFVHRPKLSAVSVSNKTFKWLWVNVIRLKDLRQIEWTKTLVIVLPFAPIVTILHSETLQNISHTVWPSFTLTGAVLLSPFTFTGFITAYKGQPTKQLVMSAGFWVRHGRAVCSTLERVKRLRTPVMAGRKHVKRWVAVCCGRYCMSSTLKDTVCSRHFRWNSFKWSDYFMRSVTRYFFKVSWLVIGPGSCAAFRIENFKSIPGDNLNISSVRESYF